MISLAGAMNGSERCKEYEGLARKVVELSNADKIRIPLSLSHVVETGKIKGDRHFRVREFMGVISKLNVIVPPISREGRMVVNKLLRVQNRHPIHAYVLPHGSYGACLDADEANMFKNIATYFAPIPLSSCFRSGISDDVITAYVTGANNYSKDFLKKFNERKKEQKHSLLREELLINNLNFMLSQGRLPRGKESRFKRMVKKYEPEDLLRLAPFHYNKCLLEYERLKTGVLQRNDFFDVLSLSTAMPYCDVVVFESAFTNLARTAKIPGARLFSTKQKEIKEFEAFLDTLA